MNNVQFFEDGSYIEYDEHNNPTFAHFVEEE